MSGPNFGALHEQRAVGLLLDVARIERAREARPAGAGFELVGRAEQRLTRYDVHVDPFLMIVPVRVLEGSLRRFVLRDFVLHWRQGAPELGVTWFRFQCIGLPCSVTHCSCSDLSRLIAPHRAEPPVTATAGAIHPIANRILLGVILVVLLSRIE